MGLHVFSWFYTTGQTIHRSHHTIAHPRLPQHHRTHPQRSWQQEQGRPNPQQLGSDLDPLALVLEQPEHGGADYISRLFGADSIVGLLNWR